jgi:putative RecB family exonuclease
VLYCADDEGICVPVYSHSRLSAFEKCPLQYRYRYIDRIKREVQGIEAFMGQRVHEVLERLYRDLAAGERRSLEELLALYRASWDEHYSDAVRIVRTERTAGHYRQVGETCIGNYYRAHHPFTRGDTIGLEERVHVSLDSGERYRIQGYIDRLARDGEGVYEIHDYKTSASLPSDSALRQDRQLSLYQMAVQARFPDARAIRLVWHYLVFSRQLVSSRTEAEIEGHRVRTMRLIDTIEAAHDFPARESALCRWCDYRDICPAQKDAYRAELEAATGRPRSDAGREPFSAGREPSAAVRPMRQLDLFS